MKLRGENNILRTRVPHPIRIEPTKERITVTLIIPYIIVVKRNRPTEQI